MGEQRFQHWGGHAEENDVFSSEPSPRGIYREDKTNSEERSIKWGAKPGRLEISTISEKVLERGYVITNRKIDLRF